MDRFLAGGFFFLLPFSRPVYFWSFCVCVCVCVCLSLIQIHAHMCFFLFEKHDFADSTARPPQTPQRRYKEYLSENEGIYKGNH